MGFSCELGAALMSLTDLTGQVPRGSPQPSAHLLNTHLISLIASRVIPASPPFILNSSVCWDHCLRITHEETGVKSGEPHGSRLGVWKPARA